MPHIPMSRTRMARSRLRRSSILATTEEQTYKDLLQGKRADGTYPVADKLVEIAKYYGLMVTSLTGMNPV